MSKGTFMNDVMQVEVDEYFCDTMITGISKTAFQNTLIMWAIIVPTENDMLYFIHTL